MTLLDRLEALKVKLLKREDAELLELVQILIDGPEPKAEPAPIDATAAARAAEASRSLSAMEAATQAKG